MEFIVSIGFEAFVPVIIGLELLFLNEIDDA